MTVSDDSTLSEQVFLDASTLKPVSRYSLIHDALSRELYEASLGGGGQIRTRLVWQEGDPYPGTLDTEQANLLASAGETYRFFDNAWGRDSYDGLGGEMVTINGDSSASRATTTSASTASFCHGVTTDACSPLTNAAAVAGKWVYVDEGDCGFQTPVDHVAAAGGAGIVLGNKFADEGAFAFPVEADISGVMVTRADGARFRQADTATVTISPVDGSPRADSHRWLASEKSAGFGGAIRDMWNPTC